MRVLRGFDVLYNASESRGNGGRTPSERFAAFVTSERPTGTFFHTFTLSR